MNGSDLTDFSCQAPIKINFRKPIEVKFDTHDTSQKMELSYYSNLEEEDFFGGHSSSVYIGPKNYSHDYWGFFINGLLTANTVAIKITPSNDYAKGFWVRFTLKGSKAAIGQLGKQMPK